MAHEEILLLDQSQPHTVSTCSIPSRQQMFIILRFLATIGWLSVHMSVRGRFGARDCWGIRLTALVSNKGHSMLAHVRVRASPHPIVHTCCHNTQRCLTRPSGRDTKT